MLKIRPRVRRERETPLFNIGTASRLTGLPIWTLRWIEKHELIAPERTEGRQRLFSEADIDLLGEIAALIEEGVNLPGVRVILRLKIESGVFVATRKRKGGR